MGPPPTFFLSNPNKQNAGTRTSTPFSEMFGPYSMWRNSVVRTMIDEDLPTIHVVEATKAENQLRMIQSATE